MKNLEFSANVSIGQYIDTHSAIHRLTPATKFLGIFAFFAATFANTSATGTLALCLVVLALSFVARIGPAFFVRGLRPALPFLGLLALLTLLFQSEREASVVVASLGPWRLHLGTLLSLLLLFSRFAAIMAAIGLLTSVTSEREIAHGVEDALAPLGRVGIPTHEFSLMIAISLRFIPIVTGELEAIVKAQATRGGDFGASGFNPLRKARSYIPLFVPLVVRTLERAELLVEAMEARAWLGAGRKRYAKYEMAPGEGLVRLGLLAFTLASVTLGLTIGKNLP